jgi:probable HAF family extracellular repeat protein
MLTWLDGGPGWEAVMPRDINQWGDIAGVAFDYEAGPTTPQTAFAHSAISGTVNLNELGAAWWDLNAAGPTLAAGWRASQAFGINDAGEIVGTATNANPNVPTRAFLLVDAFGPAPHFLLLPTVGTGDQYGRRINNHGEAVGHAIGRGVIRYRRSYGGAWPYYAAVLEISASVDGIMDINDDGVIVARNSGVSSTVSYRQLVTGTTAVVFAGYEFWSVSNGANAMISGYRTSVKRGQSGGPIRLPVLGTANSVQLLSSFGVYARAINDAGDTVFESYGRGYLYSDAINPATGIRYGTNGDGVLPLDRLVVNQNADWLDGIRLDGINNHGTICGFTPAGPSRGFVLTPFVPAP